jgi:hypothetical protein
MILTIVLIDVAKMSQDNAAEIFGKFFIKILMPNFIQTFFPNR